MLLPNDVCQQEHSAESELLVERSRGSIPSVAIRRLRPDRFNVGANEHGRIRAFSRSELLRASVIDLGGVQISFLVDVHAVHSPETAREIAEGAPGVEEVSVQVVFDHLVCAAIEKPKVPITR